MNFRGLRFFATVSSLSLIAIVAHAKVTRAGDAQVSFTATGPAGLSIVGTTSELAIAENDQEVVVTVPLKNLDTKIDLRNRHMRDKYLEVGKYPNAELHVPKGAVQGSGGTANGQLTLHGQTKPIAFSYTTKADGPATNVNGKLRLNMQDFGIEKPGYAGVSVKPDVDVNVSFRVTKE
jgi:polyisoprenoid-binding protein YceI